MTHADLSAWRSFASLGLGAVALGLCASGGGCELAVPDTLPAFSCHFGPDSCPSDEVCATTTMQCVPRSRACSLVGCPHGGSCDKGTELCEPTDGGVSGDSHFDVGTGPGADAVAEGDGRPDTRDAVGDNTGDQGMIMPDTGGDSGCSGLGCRCSGGSDCASGVCGDSQSVTQDVYMAASSASFCTRPCCTSADCDPSTVCFATAAGGNYCVRPQWLGRPAGAVGAKIGGQACAADTECRSLRCAPGGTCADTCCSTAQSSAQCASGTLCRFGNFPGNGFDMHYTAFCSATTAPGTNGSTCVLGSECRSNWCQTNACHDACHSSADCGSTQACIYGAPPMFSTGTRTIAAACFATLGFGAVGAACQSNTDCKSNFCDSVAKVCTDVCFGNSDCTQQSGWRCRPESVAVQSGGTYSVLSCGK